MGMQHARSSVRALSRRSAIFLGTTGIAAATCRPHTSLAQPAPATFVLVHGAWAGSWIWRDVITRLRAAGHTVYATTATGLGDRDHLADPAIDLDVHITDVVKLLEYEDLHDVTLVGWSYGGMIITGVADRVPERLAHLVYLDADVPANGESGWDAERYSDEARAADVASGADEGMPGFFTVAPYRGWIATLVPDPATRDWLFANFVPQSVATYNQPIHLGIKDLAENPVAALIPRTFIFCTEGKGDAESDHTVRTMERLRDDSGWTVIELAETHFAPVNHPAAVVNALHLLV